MAKSSSRFWREKRLPTSIALYPPLLPTLVKPRFPSRLVDSGTAFAPLPKKPQRFRRSLPKLPRVEAGPLRRPSPQCVARRSQCATRGVFEISVPEKSPSRCPRVLADSGQEFTRGGKSLPLPLHRNNMGFIIQNCGPRRRLSRKDRFNMLPPGFRHASLARISGHERSRSVLCAGVRLRQTAASGSCSGNSL
jgi:hypothetical protein